MNNPLLSICIPTYNQPKEVERLLNTLSKQVPRDGSVELVVRDDSPNEETKKIVDSFEDLKIRYFHGEKGGLDKAIIALTQEAKGEYVWWLGDDDLADNAVAKILEVFKEHPEVSFLFVNGQNENNPDSLAIKIKTTRFFRDSNEVISEISDLLGFISATIFRRTLAIGGLEDSKKFLGSAFVNLYIILFVLAGSKSNFFIREPLIITKPKDPKDKLWYDPVEVFGFNLPKIAREFRGYFAGASLRLMLRKNLSSVWRTILIRKAEKERTKQISRVSSWKLAYKMLKTYPTFPEVWLASVLVVLPSSFLKFFYKVYKFFFPSTYQRFTEKD